MFRRPWGRKRSLDESDAIRRAQRGNSEAFGLLVENHQRTVYNIAFRMVRDREAALDLAQEAFLEAFAHIDRFVATKPFGPWVYRIVHNRSLNYLKRRAHRSAPRLGLDRGNELATSQPAPEARMDRRHLADRLRGEVERLPERLKGAFVLRYLEDRSVAEVANILSVPINTIKTHLFRAREHLRKKLEHYL